MSGPFGDSSDANRKPRGPRPFAGQAHVPGSGPLKSSRVRRPTLAPFPSLPEPVARATRAMEPPPAELEPRERPDAAHSELEADAPAIDAFAYEDPHESSIDAYGAADDIASEFAGHGETAPQELPFAPFAHDEPEATDLAALAGVDDDASVVPEPKAVAPDPFAEIEEESYTEPFADALPDDAHEMSQWANPSHEDEPPHSALHTEELRDRDLGARDARDDLAESSASPDEDDWFSEAGNASTGDDLADAPFDTIESIGEPPRSMTAPDGTEGTSEPPVPLPVDWAVSPEGEADLQSYVAGARLREEASDVLEGVARRVRSGEIVLALEPGASTEAVLASVLASLLT